MVYSFLELGKRTGLKRLVHDLCIYIGNTPVSRQIGKFLGVELLSYQVDAFKILMHISKGVLLFHYNIYTV